MTITFDWAVPADHPALAGHFPGRPIVPGVVLLDHLLLHLAPTRVANIAAAKFSSPALPGERLHFALDAKASGALAFRISCDAREIASGTLNLVAP